MRQSLLLLAALAAPGAAAFSCKDGLQCTELKANNMTFHCRFAGQDTGVPVMFLHGFPEFATMWQDTQLVLAEHTVHSVACNLRGYSPGAAPVNEADYDYDILRSDIWALADAAGFKKFHLIAHDHGAALGWTAAGSDIGKQRLLSYTAMSVPHLDAFGAGLVGDDADVDQQVASQYFSMFIMNNSASLDFSAMFHTMANSGTDEYSDRFAAATDFQKALWWYNGAVNAGWMALPPLFSAKDLLLKYHNPVMSGLRAMYSGGDLAKKHPEGVPATRHVGAVTIPTLFVCGSKDPALLCTKPYSLHTKDYVSASYTYLEVDCPHDVTTVAKDCAKGEVAKVRAAILDHIGAPN
eukprot:TRINITY_DN4506_c0_g1_i1.p1 TRINITY_DN4506_c0_g1~~TRINITY_DN4506_c0_g1_i1.p1  ORF type:complete len:352 (+),score=134.50 TRINITY_DN4506_c0_g1_i1:55-1110(+)